jgi:hypothetical protein
MRLLHYRGRWFGGVKSKIEGKHFFLSPRGRFDPQSELEADLAAARVPDSDFHCHFPARFRFLKDHFELPTPTKSCKNFDNWIRTFRADSVSVVFAAPFFSNPSSAMGHIFLRFSAKDRSRLSDLALGYAAAMPEGVNGLSYVYNGLSGGFEGSVFVDPYYSKVHEYSLVDNRDLWEYKLNFSPEEVRILLEHIWEFWENGTQYYYFLDENCSLMLLNMLNAVRPHQDLDHGLYLYVLPIQTAKVLDRMGWISEVSFYPSQRRILSADIQSLNPEQKRQFEQKLLPPDRKVLDTLIDYYGFRKVENHYQLPAEDTVGYRDALIARAKLSGDPEALDVPVPERADQGNDPHHIGIAGGASTGGAFTDLTLYPGVHEPIDPENGYVPLSEVTILGSRVRYYTSRKTFVPESIRFVDIASRTPYAWYDPLRSWHASVEFDSREAEGCYSCVRGSGNVAYGMGAFLGSKKVYAYAMGAATLENGLSWSPPLRLLLGPEAGILLRFGDRFKTVSYFRDQWTTIPVGLPLNRAVANLDAGYLLTRSCEIAAQMRWSLTTFGNVYEWQEASLGAKWFF